MIAVLTEGPKLWIVIGTSATGDGSARVWGGAADRSAAADWLTTGPVEAVPLPGPQPASSATRMRLAPHAARIDGPVIGRSPIRLAATNEKPGDVRPPPSPN